MPRYSKHVIALNELSEAMVSNCICNNAMKLLVDESDEDYNSDEDDELFSGRITVTVHYAVCNMSCYLFRQGYYHPDIRMNGLKNALPQWQRI
jgi:hypothetical protein